MPAPRRMYVNNQVYFVTNRTAEGLPFVACLYINLLIYGVLARAQRMYPDITVCAWLFLANHYHGVVVTRGDPAMLRYFMNFVDGEIAKIVARLLGKRHVRIWAQTYHAAVMLDYDTVVRKLTYLYINPVQAYLVAHVSDWRGVSTWNEFLGKATRRFKYMPPSRLRRLPRGAFSKQHCQNLVKDMVNMPGCISEFIVEPFAWTACFQASENRAEDEVREEILQSIRRAEEEIGERRHKEKRGIVGAEALSKQDPYRKYKPTIFGRRVYCISTCAELRKQFIELYKDFCARCVQTWNNWKKGNLSASYPPGAFLPSRPPPASRVPIPI